MNAMLFGLEASDSKRTAISTTLLVSLVSFLTLSSSEIPPSSVVTRLDDMMIVSTANCFAVFTFFQLSMRLNLIAVDREASMSRKRRKGG
jgi:archaellum biogenesis protein FlaJ (TadC family)